MSEKRLVYVVTHGCYSDYHICGVYSTKEAADKMAAAFSREGREPADVEEWELDKWLGEENSGRHVRKVRLNLATGNMVSVTLLAPTENPYDAMHLDHPGKWVNGRMVLTPVEERCLVTKVWSESDEHAVKVASERRAGWLLKPWHEWDYVRKDGGALQVPLLNEYKRYSVGNNGVTVTTWTTEERLP